MHVELTDLEVSRLIQAVSAGLESGQFTDAESTEFRAMLIKLGSLKEVGNGTTNVIGISRPSGPASARPIEHGTAKQDTATGSDNGASDGSEIHSKGFVPGG